MKKQVNRMTIGVALISSGALGLSSTSMAQTIIMDQIGPDDGSMVGTNITGCQDFEAAYDIYDIATLDNFTGAGGENIGVVEMCLNGWNGFVDPSSVSGYTANLHSSPSVAAINLIGDIGSSYALAADCTQSTTWTGAGFVISMPTSMFAAVGDNWISMIPSNDFATGGQIGVADALVGDGVMGWNANPGGGFGMPGNMQEMTNEAAYRIFSGCEPGFDCNKNGIDDCDDIWDGTSEDCNFNDIPDECDISTGVSQDEDFDGIPDECQDCNGNGILDSIDISNGTSTDCNENGLPDECEDCNNNGIADECDIAEGTSQDIDENGIPDECQDCNNNGIADHLDIQDGTSFDCDQNGVPDECQPDCDGDGWIDPCDNDGDLDGDGIPDNCEEDCNGNTLPDHWEIEMGWVEDCNDNLIPDECDLADGTAEDCNNNLIPDECDINNGTSSDDDGNGIPDECEIPDCNGNEIDDEIDIAKGTSEDVNYDGIPDECQCIADVNNDGTVNVEDLLLIAGYWGSSISAGDINNDGTVNVLDLLIVVSNWGECPNVLLTCTSCDIQFYVGSRVVSLVDNPDGNEEIFIGSLGTVVCGLTDQSYDYLVEWDDISSGNNGSGWACMCGNDGDPSSKQCWWVWCDTITYAQ